MASATIKMADVLINNPIVLRGCILYKFTKGKDPFETYKILMKQLGDDFMEYPEFEFWFTRFAQGKYDLDYDKSLDPKARVLTDLPVYIFEKIGDSLKLRDRFALRKVSKDIQAVVDCWTPKVTDIELAECWWYAREMSHVDRFSPKFDENWMSFFKNPKLRLEFLKLVSLGSEMENQKMKRIFEKITSNHKIHVKHFDVHNLFSIAPTVFNAVDSKKLEEVTIHIDEKSEFDEFLSSEHIKNIKMLNVKASLSTSAFPMRAFRNCPRLTIEFRHDLIDFLLGQDTFVKKIVDSAQLQTCYLSGKFFSIDTDYVIQKFTSPEYMVPNLRRYPIAGSNDFYEIEFECNEVRDIRIERKVMQ